MLFNLKKELAKFNGYNFKNIEIEKLAIFVCKFDFFFHKSAQSTFKYVRRVCPEIKSCIFSIVKSFLLGKI